MKYNLKRPCSNCPFRSDVHFPMTKARRRDIAKSILNRQETFSCHKTNEFCGDNAIETQNSQHCAGAMVILEKMERPNQMMRIAERLGMYDRENLDMDSPVYDDLQSWIDAGD